MGGNGGRDAVAGAADEFDPVCRRHVLQDDLETGESIHERRESARDEFALAVEYVDLLLRDLAVDHQGKPALLHRAERRSASFEVRHTVSGIRRRPRRVELDPEHLAARSGAVDLLGAGLVGKVEGHERLERCAGRNRGENPVAIGERSRRRRHRWRKVRHRNRTREPHCGRGHHVGEDCTVAEVRVPVIRPYNIDFIHEVLDPRHNAEIFASIPRPWSRPVLPPACVRVTGEPPLPMGRVGDPPARI